MKTSLSFLESVIEAEEIKLAELHDMLRRMYTHDQFAIHERIIAFHDVLKGRYADVRSCRMFHLISGSTVQAPITRMDYEGEDSIEAFIRREHEAVFGDKVAQMGRAA